MKNLYKLLFFLIIFLLFNNNTVEAASTYNKLNENFYYEEGITKKEANKINNYIKFIPKDIYNHFINNNGSIYIVHNTYKIPLIKGICHHIKGNKYDVADNIFYMKNENTNNGIIDFFSYYTYNKVFDLAKISLIEDFYYRNNTKILSRQDIFLKYFKEYCFNKDYMDEDIYKILDKLFSFDKGNIEEKIITHNNFSNTIENYIDINERGKIEYVKYNEILYYDNTVDTQILHLLDVVISTLPENILLKIQKENYTIIITDKDLKVNNLKAAGFAVIFEKFIVINSNVINRIDSIFYHELGHIIDYNYSNNTFLHRQTEFLQLYYNNINTYKNINLYSKPKGNYETSNAQEFFACSFEDYISSPIQLKTQYPDIFKYMEKLVADKLSL